MSDHPTPDPAEQDPFARTILYAPEETSLGYLHIQFRGLTPDEATAALRAVRKALQTPIRAADGGYLVVTSARGGRPPWSGHFHSAEDFLSAARTGLAALLNDASRPALTQLTLLGWLADTRDEKFRNCDPARITTWCTKAGTSWDALKEQAASEFRVGFEFPHLPPSGES